MIMKLKSISNISYNEGIGYLIWKFGVNNIEVNWCQIISYKWAEKEPWYSNPHEVIKYLSSYKHL